MVGICHAYLFLGLFNPNRGDFLSDGEMARRNGESHFAHTPNAGTWRAAPSSGGIQYYFLLKGNITERAVPAN